MSTQDRKLELERKKAKLAALRDSRNKREKVRADAYLNGSPNSLSTSASAQNLRTEAEELLRDLNLSEVGIPHPASGDSAPLRNGINSNHAESARSKRPRKLALCHVNEVDVAPKSPIHYSKQTQTKDTTVPVPHSVSMQHTGSPREVLGSPKFIAHLEWDDEFSTAARRSALGLSFDETLPEPLDQTDLTRDSIQLGQTTDDQGRPTKAEDKTKVVVLSEEDRNLIMATSQFQSFFDHASRICERALTHVDDIFVDYTGADQDRSSASRHQLLSLSREFYDDRWSRRRGVTALDWSPFFSELLLGGYHCNEDAPHEPDGVCLIWNLKYTKPTPEYIFHCQSRVVSATFAKYSPNLIIGGTYSGQIVLWDNRCNKRTPVQRTLLSATAHTHPVKSVLVVGTQNAHSLISISSDGKLCSWSLEMLSQPNQFIELVYRQTRPVGATCMCFLHHDVDHFLVGSEDGRVYTGSRHENKAGVTELFEGHQAYVTSVSSHTTEGPVDFSHLFLTTSFDWSVKLWSSKVNQPLLSFNEATDFTMDADWSPVHPAVFSTVDCTGVLDVWNLNQDTEVPCARAQVEGRPGLNTCRFHSSGTHVAVGDMSGRIHVYDLNEVMASPRANEWNLLAQTIEEARPQYKEPALGGESGVASTTISS